jgi:hypothetical protein
VPIEHLLQVGVDGRLLRIVGRVTEIMIAGMAGGMGYRVWSRGALDRESALHIGALFVGAVVILLVLESI